MPVKRGRDMDKEQEEERRKQRRGQVDTCRCQVCVQAVVLTFVEIVQRRKLFQSSCLSSSQTTIRWIR